MEYVAAREYLDQVSVYGSVLGLSNIRELLRRLENPQEKLKFIHIAGTNGKGSTLAYISTILTASTYKVGRYISPTIIEYEERIQIDGIYIPKEKLAFYTNKLKATIEIMVKEGYSHPTIFEIETAIGFLYFKEEACDIVVLETGLGGALDATNVILAPLVTIFTSISMDHMGILGETQAEIAKEKAGIIKHGTRVVSSPQTEEVIQEIAKKCQEEEVSLKIIERDNITNIKYGIPAQFFSYKEFKDMEITMLGTHQIQNAVLSLEAIGILKELGYNIEEEYIRSGLKTAVWEGRFSVISQEPLFIIDGAHNIDGAIKLKETIETYFKDKKIYFIMGIFKDKEYEKIVELTSKLAESIFIIEPPDKERALSAKVLIEVIKPYNQNVITIGTIYETVQAAIEKVEKNDIIIAFGSLSFLGEMIKSVNKLRRK